MFSFRHELLRVVARTCISHIYPELSAAQVLTFCPRYSCPRSWDLRYNENILNLSAFDRSIEPSDVWAIISYDREINYHQFVMPWLIIYFTHNTAPADRLSIHYFCLHCRQYWFEDNALRGQLRW